MSWDTCAAAVDGVEGATAASTSLPPNQFTGHHQRLCSGPQTTNMQALITPASSPHSQSEPCSNKASGNRHAYVLKDHPPQNRQGPQYLPNLSPHQACQQCTDTPPHVSAETSHQTLDNGRVRAQHLAVFNNGYQNEKTSLPSYTRASLRQVTDPAFSITRHDSPNEMFNPPMSYLSENSARVGSRQGGYLHDIVANDNNAALKMHQLADSNFHLEQQLQEVKLLVDHQSVKLEALQQENASLKSRMQEQQQWQQWKTNPRQYDISSSSNSCSYHCYYHTRDCPSNGPSRHRHQSLPTVIQDPLAALLYADKVLNAEAHRSASDQLLTPNTPISMFSNYPSNTVTPSEQTESASTMSSYSGQKNHCWEQKGEMFQRRFRGKGRESDGTIPASDIDYSSEDEEGELLRNRSLRRPLVSSVRLSRDSEAAAPRKIPEIGSFFPPGWLKRKATYDEIGFDDKRMKGFEE